MQWDLSNWLAYKSTSSHSPSIQSLSPRQSCLFAEFSGLSKHCLFEDVIKLADRLIWKVTIANLFSIMVIYFC